MRLSELFRNVPIKEVTGNLELDVKNIAYDSRKVTRGSLFISIEGYKDDGHGYIDDAIYNGAAAVVVQKDVHKKDGVTYLRVDDCRYALAAASSEFYGHPSRFFNLIGVTGTKGKTTITYMVKSILEKHGHKVGLIGTIANRIEDETLHAERTTPESLDLQRLFYEMKQRGVDSVVMEVSSHALDLHRVAFCDYDIGVFNNLTQDHLDFHHTFDNYLHAKAKLFSISKHGFVNIDNSYGSQVIELARCPINTYGADNEADLAASNIITYPDSVDFDVVTPWVEGHIKVDIPGKFTVYNALAAIGVCGKLGCTLKEMQEGLAKVKVMGRVEVVETGRDFSVVIDYAHSPDSLENILTTVRGFAPGRVVCVFGCGGDRDRTKRPIMGGISGRLSDFTIVTSDNPRTEDPEAIVREIEAGVLEVTDKYLTIVDRKEAIKYSIEHAQKGDIVVLAGKGHETYQTFKDKTIHFDEREIVQEILSGLA